MTLPTNQPTEPTPETDPETYEPGTVLVWYTGALIIPDGTDTNCYGEPCEPGMGYELAEGWVDPDWSLFAVWESREDVRPDVVDPETVSEDYDGDLVRAIRETVTSRLGAIDYEDGRTFYAADSMTNYRTGEDMMLAAHLSNPDGTDYYLEDPDDS